MSIDVYQIVTDRIINLLESGTIPWRQSWVGGRAGYPRNMTTGKPYRGINVFLLAVTAWQQGYESAYWLTFKQAKQRGGAVRKGEKSSLVVFWKQLEVEDKETGKKKKIPCARYYNVFNIQQCEGIDAPDTPDAAGHEPLDFQPIETAQAIVTGYWDGPTIEHHGGAACYRPGTDTVIMPEPERFTSAEAYYNVLYHELTHSAGHRSRLGRLDGTPAAFGSREYSKEELIAEMGAAFLSGQAGIAAQTLEDSAAYIQGWVKKLRGDKRLVIQTAGAAQKAADWILGQRRDVQAD